MKRNHGFLRWAAPLALMFPLTAQAPYGGWDRRWNDGDRWDESRRDDWRRAPYVRVDTAGRGALRSGNNRLGEVTRGWVDTSGGRAVVGFTGRNRLRAFFDGHVVESNSRRLVVRITGSDFGRADGTAELYLNRDRNEVERIQLRARTRNGPVEGYFTR